jgi:hypothetical protein
MSAGAADGDAVATSRTTAAETKYSLLEHVATWRLEGSWLGAHESSPWDSCSSANSVSGRDTGLSIDRRSRYAWTKGLKYPEAHNDRRCHSHLPR